MIKNWFVRLPKDAQRVATAIAVIILLIVLAWVTTMTRWMLDGAREVEFAKPRLSRLLGYESMEAELLAAARQTSEQLDELAFGATADGRSGPKLQQAVRNYATEAGLVVLGSRLVAGDDQIEEEGEAPAFSLLAVNVRGMGPPIAIDAFLESLAKHRPRLAVSSLEIQKPRSHRGATREAVPGALSVEATVEALLAVAP